MQLDLDGILHRVVDLAVKLVGAEQASLYLFDGLRIDWSRIIDTVRSTPERSVSIVSAVSAILTSGLGGWVVREKKPVLVEDTRTDDRWLAIPNDPFLARSALCVPFIDHDQVVAVLTLMHHEPKRFTQYHLRMAVLIANQATVAVRHAQMFKSIKTQQHQLEAVLQAIPDGIFVLDENGRILLANAAAFPLLGSVDKNKVIGQRLTSFASADSALVAVQQIVRAIEDSPLQSGTHWSFEARSEDRKQDFQVSMTAWEDQQEDLVGYVVVMHDVTTLRDLHRFKDEMLRIASHDLRSPLSLIIGYTDLIALDTPDPKSPVHEYVSVIRRSTERMSGLIDDLLRVERIRSSPLELHEQVDLQKLVKVVIVNMRPLAERRKQRFETILALHDVPKIMADPVLIRQSMENLVGNAIKYTPEGGRITVRAYAENGQLFFVVEDTGIGIPKDALSYIFNSFYRVRNKSTENVSGAGLGLSFVKAVIERHGGQVWVESEEGKGSKFGFRIPFPIF
jgi:PAS domain S-box-containing protein